MCWSAWTRSYPLSFASKKVAVAATVDIAHDPTTIEAALLTIQAILDDQRLLLMERAWASAFILMAMDTYAHPAELGQAKVSDLYPPRSKGGTVASDTRWSLVLAPAAGMRVTKKDTQDDTIQLCLNPARPNLSPFLKKMSCRAPGDCLLPIPLKHIRRLHASHCSRAQVPSFTPHQLRHGGASHYGYCGSSALEIQTRGRWGTPSSVLRYLKPGRYRCELEKHSEEQQAAATSIAKTVVQQVVTMLATPPTERQRVA